MILRAQISMLFLLCVACGSSSNQEPLDVFSVVDASPSDLSSDGSLTDLGDAQDTVDKGSFDTTETIEGQDVSVEPVICSVGGYCDDGDPCTYEDECIDGICVGTSYACDDGRACTVDLCDSHGGCATHIAVGHCLINNVCYLEGERSLFNDCIRCLPDESFFSFSLAENSSPCGLTDPCLSEGICTDGLCSGGATGCDDANPCTDDYCDLEAGCVNSPNFDLCEDGNPCTLGDQCENAACLSGLLPLDCDDGNPCSLDLCTPLGCEYANLDAACTDGDFCTDSDLCIEGLCVPGTPRPCSDGNDCTLDSCNSVVGCEHQLIENPCCVGSVHVCNDGNSCTVDNCDPELGDCSYELATGTCNDGDACTDLDNCNASALCVGQIQNCDDGNPCTIDSCDSGSGCTHTPSSGDCDDGNACTENDICYGLGQCTGTPLFCDDGNVCTQDQCSAITGCIHQALTGACSDGDSCTTGDFCVAGSCVGEVLDCDDGNPCTADNCHPVVGCNHALVSGPCDDGSDCTEDDFCSNGVCQGVQVGLCCTPEFSGPTVKVTSFSLGEAGIPGHALDVDNDPDTCSPASNCESGIDNSLSAFASLANEPLAEEVANGGLIALIELKGFNVLGELFEIHFWEGKKVDGACDLQTMSCDYWVKEAAVSASCSSLFNFDNAEVTNGKLSAGGVGYGYPILLKIGGADIALELENAKLEADLVLVNGQPTELSGVIGGAVSKSVLASALAAIPDDQLPDGISKQALLTLVNVLIKNDIDLDSDGTPDAASIGVRVQAISGTIVGVEP